jgi:predicted DNA-binding transcriptional regulator AlpA
MAQKLEKSEMLKQPVNGATGAGRLMRWREVQQLVGASRSTVWRWEREGAFPHRLQTGPKSVRWRASEVQAWLESLQVAGAPVPAE